MLWLVLIWEKNKSKSHDGHARVRGTLVKFYTNLVVMAKQVFTTNLWYCEYISSGIKSSPLYRIYSLYKNCTPKSLYTTTAPGRSPVFCFRKVYLPQYIHPHGMIMWLDMCWPLSGLHTCHSYVTDTQDSSPFLHPSLQNKLIMYKKSTELYTWLFHAGHVVWLVVINIANMSRYFSTSFLLRLAIFYTKALIFCTFYKNILRPSISNFIIYISKVRQYSWEVRRSIWM